jgi:hypothetical protein
MMSPLNIRERSRSLDAKEALWTKFFTAQIEERTITRAPIDAQRRDGWKKVSSGIDLVSAEI